ncbi:MAG: ribonuclease H family protein [Candidatus Thiodiazotropha endolucinida]|nr:ribonuclease H family protein [Candidatus Thiodiazotropha endolucinida]
MKNRQAVINMAGEKTEEFNTNTGLPQGSVISPLLFTLFIADCYEKIKCEKVKFADDGTLWKSGKDCGTLLKSLQEELGQIIEWANRWRLKLNISKTEFCVFSQNNQTLEEARAYRFTFDDKIVKYNPNPKILGITLDEKLKFDIHTEQIEQKALRSLDLLRKVKITEAMTPKCMLQLYKALIVPQLEYAAAVWQIGNCTCLDKIQRKGLAICLGIPVTAGVEALEVEAGIKPLEVRREELAIRQAAKIMMKEDDACIKVSWDRFMDSELVEQKISPFGKMNVQVADMFSNTGVSLHGLEKEVNYMESIRPSKRKPEYWQNLGSSKSRTSEQELLSREIIGDLLEKCDTETAVAFTDGSCLGNPGPCGAGACIFPPGETEPVLLKQPVSSRGSILLGELVAIKMALQFIYKCKTQHNKNVSKAHIFSDSQSAVGQLVLQWEARSHKATVLEVKADLKRLERVNVAVEISWSPGHANIQGNEQADKLAKEAAQEAKDKVDLPAAVTIGDVKSAASQSGIKKWQERWEKSETGRHLFTFRPFVTHKIKHVYDKPHGQCIISQLRTGYVGLGEYLKKCNLKESDQCECGAVESVNHYLLECPKHENAREIMRRRLFENCGIIHLNLHVLLDANPEDELNDWRSTILTELENFVGETKRFPARLKY